MREVLSLFPTPKRAVGPLRISDQHASIATRTLEPLKIPPPPPPSAVIHLLYTCRRKLLPRSDRSLVTNLPKPCMSYIGFPFPEEVPSFPTHSQILDYLRSYAEQHDVLKLIRFNCPVISVRMLDSQGYPFENGALLAVDGFCANSNRDPVENMEVLDGAGSHGTKWEVMYRCLALMKEGHQTGLTGDVYSNGTSGTAASTPPRGTEDCDTADDSDTTASRVFDAVCVCNGKFIEPFTPEVAGIDKFRGTVMHAQEYDSPHVEAFEGRRVLCVGAGYSARDIAREVSSVGKFIFLVFRGGGGTESPRIIGLGALPVASNNGFGGRHRDRGRFNI